MSVITIEVEAMGSDRDGARCNAHPNTEQNQATAVIVQHAYEKIFNRKFREIPSGEPVMARITLSTRLGISHFQVPRRWKANKCSALTSDSAKAMYCSARIQGHV